MCKKIKWGKNEKKEKKKKLGELKNVLLRLYTFFSSLFESIYFVYVYWVISALEKRERERKCFDEVIF